MKTLPKITALTITLALISSTIAHAQTPNTNPDTGETAIEEIEKKTLAPNSTIEKIKTSEGRYIEIIETLLPNTNRNKRFSISNRWHIHVYFDQHEQHMLRHDHGYNELWQQALGKRPNRSNRQNAFNAARDHARNHGICPNGERLEGKSNGYSGCIR